MKPVFWSTGAQTALAEAEVEYQERDDTAVFVKFPIISGRLKDKASIAIWTTTPWTLAGEPAHCGASEGNLRRPGIHQP